MPTMHLAGLADVSAPPSSLPWQYDEQTWRAVAENTVSVPGSPSMPARAKQLLHSHMTCTRELYGTEQTTIDSGGKPVNVQIA